MRILREAEGESEEEEYDEEDVTGSEVHLRQQVISDSIHCSILGRTGIKITIYIYREHVLAKAKIEKLF